jgi:hypothetical protein
MSILFSGGKESEGPSSWEPEPYELPLVVPSPAGSPRKAPPCGEEDDDCPDSSRRVIIIDLV